MDILDYDYESLRKNPDWISPVKLAIQQFDGAPALACLLQLERTAVHKWGTDIPSKHIFRILQLAKKTKKDLTCTDLICGRLPKKSKLPKK